MNLSVFQYLHVHLCQHTHTHICLSIDIYVGVSLNIFQSNMSVCLLLSVSLLVCLFISVIRQVTKTDHFIFVTMAGLFVSFALNNETATNAVNKQDDISYT